MALEACIQYTDCMSESNNVQGMQCDPVEGASGAELASRRTEPHHAVQAETTRRTGITKQDVLPCSQTVEFWCERDLVYGDDDDVQCLYLDIS